MEESIWTELELEVSRCIRVLDRTQHMFPLVPSRGRRDGHGRRRGPLRPPARRQAGAAQD